MKESGLYSVCSYYFVFYSLFQALFLFTDIVHILSILIVLLYFTLMVYQFMKTHHSIIRQHCKVILIFKILTSSNTKFYYCYVFHYKTFWMWYSNRLNIQTPATNQLFDLGKVTSLLCTSFSSPIWWTWVRLSFKVVGTTWDAGPRSLHSR